MEGQSDERDSFREKFSVSGEEQEKYRHRLQFWHLPPRQTLNPVSPGNYVTWTLEKFWDELRKPNHKLKALYSTELASADLTRRGIGGNRAITPISRVMQQLLDSKRSLGKALCILTKKSFQTALLGELQPLASAFACINCRVFDNSRLDSSTVGEVSSEDLEASAKVVYEWLSAAKDTSGKNTHSWFRGYVSWASNGGFTYVLDVNLHVFDAWLTLGNKKHDTCSNSISDDDIVAAFQQSKFFVRDDPMAGGGQEYFDERQVHEPDTLSTADASSSSSPPKPSSPGSGDILSQIHEPAPPTADAASSSPPPKPPPPDLSGDILSQHPPPLPAASTPGEHQASPLKREAPRLQAPVCY